MLPTYERITFQMVSGSEIDIINVGVIYCGITVCQFTSLVHMDATQCKIIMQQMMCAVNYYCNYIHARGGGNMQVVHITSNACERLRST